MSDWGNTTGGAPGWGADDTGSGHWDGAAQESHDILDAATSGDGVYSPQDARATAGEGRGCHNCGQDGHLARECPEPRQKGNMGACFNCGEEGHSKAECTKPRVFKGECRICGEKDNHPALDCPQRVIKCKNCLQEGHEALACTNPKALDDTDVPDKGEEEAWVLLGQASNDRDIPDFKEAVKILVKACPEYTYPRLEKHFRKRGYSVYLIAMEKDHGDTWTIVNLQGETGKKYAVNYFLSDKPNRPKLKSKWPASAEENLVRLADAGIPMDRGVDKCNNCDEVGHKTLKCPQEKVEIERTRVTCALCGEEGHRVRDCLQERPQPRGPRSCKVCESTEHLAKDCPNREKRTCRNCGSEDHMAKDCSVIKCRNCDAEGHLSKDCKAPKDWSRVKCRTCGEMGHGERSNICKGASIEGNGTNGTHHGDHTGGSAGGNSALDYDNTAGGPGHNDRENSHNRASAFGGAEAAGGAGGW